MALLDKPEIEALMTEFNGLAFGLLKEKAKAQGWCSTWRMIEPQDMIRKLWRTAGTTYAEVLWAVEQRMNMSKGWTVLWWRVWLSFLSTRALLTGSLSDLVYTSIYRQPFISLFSFITSVNGPLLLVKCTIVGGHRYRTMTSKEPLANTITSRGQDRSFYLTPKVPCLLFAVPYWQPCTMRLVLRKYLLFASDCYSSPNLNTSVYNPHASTSQLWQHDTTKHLRKNIEPRIDPDQGKVVTDITGYTFLQCLTPPGSLRYWPLNQ